jgi:nondiscriminating glutamyl-tRNA synthetase
VSVRVRFAPSPTGRLHVGNARTALLNWLFARQQGGRFVLRLDDTDVARSEESFERQISDDLAWLGLAPDESPESGGPYSPYRQSERLDLYRQQADRLRSLGLAYPCYCTEAELERERAAALASRRPPRYSGRCAALSEAQRAGREREGRAASLRFRAGGGKVAFKDIIKGPVEFDAALIGDFVLLRSSGLPAYNFATVVDDAAMEISHVIRGEDHLANTARQLLLYRALGARPPRFAHHSLLMAPRGGKLSKRAGELEIGSLAGKMLPQAVLGYLAGIGGAAGGNLEPLGIDELVARFDLRRAGRSAAVYDEAKLVALNAAWLRRLPAGELAGMVSARLAAAGYDVELRDQGWLSSLAEALRPNLRTLEEISHLGAIFLQDAPPRDAWARELLAQAEAREAVASFAAELEDGAGWEEAAAALKAKGLSGRKLFAPLRAALTGRRSGPELDKVFALLGRQVALRRLARAAEGS